MRFVVFFITVLFLPLQFLSQIEKKSLLWEVKNAEGKTCSYLFGTIHAIDESKFFYPKKLEKIVSKCDAICLEIAGISTNAPSVEKLMMSEKSINQLFSISQMDSIHQWAEQFLLMKPEQFDQNFDRAKPFLFMQFILKSSLPEKTKSYEIQFEEIDKMNKKLHYSQIQNANQHRPPLNEMLANIEHRVK